MGRLNVGIKFILFLLLTCGPCVNLCPIVFGQATTVSVSPSSSTCAPNQTFTINVNASGISDPSGLYGWEFILTWNSTLLTAVNVTEGPLLKSGSGSTFFTYTVNATDGSVIADCTLTGNVNGVSGDGALATMTFYVNNIGGCQLHLSEATLVDSQGQGIQCQTADGNFTVPPDIAVTDITVSPTMLVIGGTVNVNVTVRNQGNAAQTFTVTVYANFQIIGAQPMLLPSDSSSNLSFSWNTAGFELGDYTISASASIVPGELNTTNNSMQAADPVTLLYNGHDIAVIRVDPFKTSAGQGYNVSITAVVKDYGVFNETFNTTAYVNATAIGVQSVSLQSGGFATLPFAWNTSSFIKGNYTISAFASPVPNETNTTNNTLSYGCVAVTIPGDLNGDFKVSLSDLSLLAKAYNTKPGDPNWNPNSDINGDSVVSLSDLSILAKHYGQKYP